MQPIPWVRIHKVPDYVQFPHLRHVNAGVTCQTCHGQVQEMLPVYQQKSLNMGWCVNCHVGQRATCGGTIAASVITERELTCTPCTSRREERFGAASS